MWFTPPLLNCLLTLTANVRVGINIAVWPYITTHLQGNTLSRRVLRNVNCGLWIADWNHTHCCCRADDIICNLFTVVPFSYIPPTPSAEGA